MAEIDYETEKCWDIEEERPIKLNVEKLSNGTLRLFPDPMTMSYETYEDLDMGHVHPFGNDDTREDRIGVSYRSYDYEDGSCEFIARSEKDLKKWLAYPKYDGIVTLNN